MKSSDYKPSLDAHVKNGFYANTYDTLLNLITSANTLLPGGTSGEPHNV
jgi:hypothetical protein